MTSSRRVAVLGAGTMGAGIAQVFAAHGWSVALCDLSQELLDRAVAAIRGNLAVMAQAGLPDVPQADALLARITLHQQLERAVADVELVVEAVSESPKVKSAVFATVAEHAPAHAAVWSNTSTLDVFSLAPEGLRARMLVAHWFAPPHILPLVEVVRGSATADDVLAAAVQLLTALGKAPIVMGRYVPGFIINRLLRALGREAMYLIEQGYVTAEGLDQAVRTSLAPRMMVLGVMQRYDFTGLDLSAKNLENGEFVDAPVDLAPRVLLDRVAAGDLGVKTGRGFYDYEGMTPLDAAMLRDKRLLEVVNKCHAIVMAPRGV